MLPGLLKGDGLPCYALSRNLGNRSLNDFFLALSDGDIDESLSAGLKNIAKEFERITVLRNRIVHNLWLARVPKDPKGVYVAAVSRFKGKIRFSKEFWYIEDIQDFLLQCHDFEDTLHKFTIEHELMYATLDWQQAQEPSPLQYASLQNRDPKIEEWMRSLLQVEE